MFVFVVVVVGQLELSKGSLRHSGGLTGNENRLGTVFRSAYRSLSTWNISVLAPNTEDRV